MNINAFAMRPQCTSNFIIFTNRFIRVRVWCHRSAGQKYTLVSNGIEHSRYDLCTL